MKKASNKPEQYSCNNLKELSARYVDMHERLSGITGMVLVHAERIGEIRKILSGEDTCSACRHRVEKIDWLQKENDAYKNLVTKLQAEAIEANNKIKATLAKLYSALEKIAFLESAQGCTGCKPYVDKINQPKASQT